MNGRFGLSRISSRVMFGFSERAPQSHGRVGWALTRSMRRIPRGGVALSLGVALGPTCFKFGTEVVTLGVNSSIVYRQSASSGHLIQDPIWIIVLY